MTKAVITVVGSFVVGMTMRTTRMPIFGEPLFGSDFDLGPGGKGSNQAVAVARLGATASFAGIIGSDPLGAIASDLYRQEGIDTTYLRTSTQAQTAVGFIILNAAGENGILVDPGANRLMDVAFVDQVEAQIARSDVVMSVLEIPVAAATRAMQLGKRHGVRTILNPAPATRIDNALLAYVDYLTPNESELRLLQSLAPNDRTPTITLAQRLLQRGVKTLIVTLGEAGALILTDSSLQAVPGATVNVVDTTGAGDAFNAGLAMSLAEGCDLITAVQFANCAGAIACTKLGVIPALGNRAQVDELYQRTYG